MNQRKKDQAEQKVRALLDKKVQKDKSLRNAILLVHSEKYGIHWKFACGVGVDHTFHVASTGKTITSALIAKLFEQGRIDYEDPISKFLPKDLLDGLFVFQGFDYAGNVLVRHLLNHTSGTADYFTEKPKQGKSIIELAIDEPSRFWTPQETIQWTKENLEPHFPPGEGFFYSDTGYQMLGLILEEITGNPLHLSLHQEIFDPLGMKHTYQLFYSDPTQASPFPMANVYIGEKDVAPFKSLSVDWAGGGLVSTTEDLLLFIRALKNSALLKEATFDRMKNWARFAKGIDYGYGLMSFRFRDLFFLLPNKYNMWGNSGSIGSFMYYVPEFDAYVIGTFNQMGYEKKHVMFLLKVLKILSKL
ncbi:MAG: beta-lactamase family protein [Candidatus Aminicenantes bacterium]|nr:MAG: beta-lactamase family protein [Candidatus Aminicenantes bacterium]